MIKLDDGYRLWADPDKVGDVRVGDQVEVPFVVDFVSEESPYADPEIGIVSDWGGESLNTSPEGVTKTSRRKQSRRKRAGGAEKYEVGDKVFIDLLGLSGYVSEKDSLGYYVKDMSGEEYFVEDSEVSPMDPSDDDDEYYSSRKKTSRRKQAESYQLGGGWSARVVYDSDDEGEYAEAILTGPGGVEETIYPGDGRRFEPGEVQEEAQQIIDEYGDSAYQDTYQYNS